jgi:hypothetical protein
MIMKKYVVFAGLMMISTIIFAQQKSDAGSKHGKHGERLKKELSLTDDQYNSFRGINKDFAGKMSVIRKDSTLAKEVRRDKLKSLKSEKDAALKKVLTEEQFKKLSDSRSTHARKSKHRKGLTSGDHAKKMQNDLSLSDEQTSRIKAIDQEFMKKFQTLRQDKTLAKEDAHKQAKQLREEHRSKTKAVLTEEQIEKWKRKSINN